MQPLSRFIPLADSLRRLAGEQLRCTVIGSTPHLIVDDHRWMLPAIWAARESNTENLKLPLVLLDSHPELSPWDGSSSAHIRLKQARDCDEVVSLCKTPANRLSERVVHDGNWLSAALELDWVGPVTTVGLPWPSCSATRSGVLECGRIDTRLFRRKAGWLAPLHREHHETIGWKVSGQRLDFHAPPNPIYVTVDLDAFADLGDDHKGMRPWRKRELARRLSLPYKSGLAKGHSFREIYGSWLSCADFVLIAMETDMFSEAGRRRRSDRSEYLLSEFWSLIYGSCPTLVQLK
jgi:hypothetical protein